MKARNGSPQEILDQYVHSLLNKVTTDLSLSDHMIYRAYKCIADFAFAQYRNYDSIDASEQFAAARNIQRQKEHEIQRCQKALKDTTSNNQKIHLERDIYVNRKSSVKLIKPNRTVYV
jgi:hypothetical protein